MGSSCIRDWTNVSCFGRQILYWATREDLTELFYNRLSLDSPWFLHRNPQTQFWGHRITTEVPRSSLALPLTSLVTVFWSSPCIPIWLLILFWVLHISFQWKILQSSSNTSYPKLVIQLFKLLEKKKVKQTLRGFPWWYSGWEVTCQCRAHGFNPWSGKVSHALEPLSPSTTSMGFCSRAQEPQLLSLCATTTKARVP